VTGEQRGRKWESRGQPRGGSRPGERQGSEFVNLELSAEQKTKLRSWCVDPDELDAELEGLLSDGTKITIKWDDRNSCYAAFAFASDDSDNAGFILTGRGGGVSRAVRQLAFKHAVLLDGVWANYRNLAGDVDENDW